MRIKKFLRWGGWILTAGALLTVIIFTQRKYHEAVCTDIAIQISYGTTDTLLSVKDVHEMVSKVIKKCKGIKLQSINTELIESVIKQNPYISDAEAFITLDGVLKIKVLQRIPLVRIINNNGISFYLDTAGKVMPIHPDNPVRLLIARGNIPFAYKTGVYPSIKPKSPKDSVLLKSTVYKAFITARYIYNNDVLYSMIGDIYVNNHEEIEVTPVMGTQEILLGNIDNLDTKFDNLLLFYQKGITREGWHNYKSINIKYKNQVVCSKK
ncbi:MAG: hypothetical protein M0R21_11085 [Lentimicrobiaceae bacterium]|jgi:cell division protein FtsQ|nr:hypothetical protein [Lentimicrobiaceae bacterium]